MSDGDIATEAASVYRDREVQGDPNAAKHRVSKSAIRALFRSVDDEVADVRALATNGVRTLLPVRVASTANGTFATAFDNGSTVDGVTIATNDRILLKDQTDAETNGVYVVQASGAPVRATDADSASEVGRGAVYVQEGTANGGKQFVCQQAAADITLGTTDLSYAENADIGALDPRITALEASLGTEQDEDTPLQGAPVMARYDADGRAGLTENRDGSVGFRPDLRAAGQIAIATALLASSCLRIIDISGQSNALGREATTLYTDRAPAPGHGIHFDCGPHSPQNDPWDPTDANGFRPGVESIYSTGGSSYGEGAGGSSLMRWLHRKLNGVSGGIPYGWLAINNAIGGRTIEELNDGGGYESWDNKLLQVERAKGIAFELYDRLPVQVDFEYFNQGESASANAAAWTTAFATRKTDYAQVTAITGQTAPVHWILVQTSSDEDSTSVPSSWEGQADARDADPTYVHIACPRYWVVLADNTHLDGISQAVMGEYVARCAWRAIYQATTTTKTSCRIIATRRSGAIVTVYVQKPPDAGNVKFETSLLAANTNYGFRALDAGSPDTINSISAITNTPDNVPVSGEAYDAFFTITLDGTPGGTCTIEYGKNVGTTGQNKPAAWGNLCAGSTDLSLVDGRELVDWCEIYSGTPAT